MVPTILLMALDGVGMPHIVAGGGHLADLADMVDTAAIMEGEDSMGPLAGFRQGHRLLLLQAFHRDSGEGNDRWHDGFSKLKETSLHETE